MKVSGSRDSDALRDAYRATFREYAIQLDALQCLMSAGSVDSAQLDAAMQEVEKSRIAHSCARDRLARELVCPPSPPGAPPDEQHIKKTARLLWEMAGHPDGTAERDWHEAEQLVHAACSCGA